MSEYAAQRTNMVESQVRTNDVTDPRIHRAMLEIPRERFVFPHQTAVAYMEGYIPLPKGRALADPRCFAKLAQLAAVKSGDLVLDVGCATGYSAAVLARLASKVVALEEAGELADIAAENLGGLANVTVVRGALTEGAPQSGPYDVIFVAGAIERRPETLLDQLKEGGRLVVVVRKAGQGHAYLYVRGDGAFSDRAAFDAELPILPGYARQVEFAL